MERRAEDAGGSKCRAVMARIEDSSPRKRADFQRVINHEQLCKTIERGNRK